MNRTNEDARLQPGAGNTEKHIANDTPSPSAKQVVDGKDGKDDKTPTPKALIDLAMKHCTLFHDDRGEGYAETTHNDLRLTLKLRSRDFRRWLAGSHYKATGKTANNEAISSALSVLEAKAFYDNKHVE